MAGGSLKDFIHNHGKLDEIQAQYWFRIIIQGLEELRDARIFHKALKPQNILLNRNSYDSSLKVTDFGLIRKLS